MEIEFTPTEIRVLGCLIEKESTTPEAYPLTINSLTRAANQKSSREPVMELSETEIQEALDGLGRHMLVSNRAGSESRVVKYSHRLRDRRTPEFDFQQPELAVLSVLFLRGPQTPGEIRTRSTRIYQFQDMNNVDETLENLIERSDGPYVKQLPRQPGQKESRYAHLFCGDTEDVPERAPNPPPVAASHGRGPKPDLEERVTHLEDEMLALQEKFRRFSRQFE